MKLEKERKKNNNNNKSQEMKTEKRKSQEKKDFLSFPRFSIESKEKPRNSKNNFFSSSNIRGNQLKKKKIEVKKNFSLLPLSNGSGVHGVGSGNRLFGCSGGCMALMLLRRG